MKTVIIATVGLMLGSGLGYAADSKEAPMKGFVGDIEAMTEANSDYRRVLYTAAQMQLVLMALQPGEEIGEETHEDGTQFIRVEKGNGEVWIDGTRTLKLYTLYAPPEHVDGTVNATKADAEASQEHFDGRTTE